MAGQATAAYFGRTDVTTVDLEDPAYLDWLSGLELAVRRTDGSIATMLTAPAEVDIVGTTEADAGPQIASAAVTEKPVVLYPRPVATADVVLAPIAGSRVTTPCEAWSRDEAGGRWPRRAGGSRARTSHPVSRHRSPCPAGNGLPSPGLLVALRNSLTEIR